MEKIRILALDLETTGTDPEKNEIIEVGFAMLQGDKILEGPKSFLVRPRGEVPEDILKLVGISIEELEKAPYIEEAFSANDFIGKVRLADAILGHNVSFDSSFLKAVLRKVFQQEANFRHEFCTLKLARGLARAGILKYRGRFSLPCLAKALGFANDSDRFHRASTDVKATIRLWSFLLDLMKNAFGQPIYSGIVEHLMSLGKKPL